MYVSCQTSASQICPTQPVLRLRSIWKSNILSQSLDVQQKSQNTRTHWSRIDTQLGVSLMSRKAVFLFSFLTLIAAHLFRLNSVDSEKVHRHRPVCFQVLRNHAELHGCSFRSFCSSLLNQNRLRGDLWTLTPPVKWVPL